MPEHPPYVVCAVSGVLYCATAEDAKRVRHALSCCACDEAALGLTLAERLLAKGAVNFPRGARTWCHCSPFVSRRYR